MCTWHTGVRYLGIPVCEGGAGIAFSFLPISSKVDETKVQNRVCACECCSLSHRFQ